MDDDEDIFDVAVPPSPIATSTQLSQRTARFFPPLPNPPVDVEFDISDIDVDLTQAAGQVIRDAALARVNRPTTSTQQSSGRLQDWVVRTGHVVRDGNTQFRIQRHIHRPEPESSEVIDIDTVVSDDDDDGGDDDDDDDSDVISIGEGDSDIERVEDSDDVTSVGEEEDLLPLDEPGPSLNPRPGPSTNPRPVNLPEGLLSTSGPTSVVTSNEGQSTSTAHSTEGHGFPMDHGSLARQLALALIGQAHTQGTQLSASATSAITSNEDQAASPGHSTNSLIPVDRISQLISAAPAPSVAPSAAPSVAQSVAPSVTLSAAPSAAPSSSNPTFPSTPVLQGPSARLNLNPTVTLISVDALSPADFRSPKRKRVTSPECSSTAAAGDHKVEEEEDGDCCPICFEPWTTSGLHRLASLRCGHLFGQSCIEKWLKGQGGKCPHCNAKAKRQDVRVLYAKSIKAVDTTERDRALKDLEKEREACLKSEMEGAQLRLQYQMVVEESNSLKLELENLRSQLRTSGGLSVAGSSKMRSFSNTKPGSSQVQIAGQFLLDKTIKIWDAGQCRVMAYCPSLATIVASQPSSSPLFPGFGVKKISTLDFKTCQYLTIHSKAIRDVAFHPAVEDGMLLSCGLDKKIKMTSLLSNSVVQSYDAPMPAWSCVWNKEDRNYFYSGLQNGLVLEFDVRNTGGPVQELNKEGTRSPVASLCYMCSDMRADFRSGGLLVGQLDRISFFEKLPSNQHRLHLLPLEGMLTSLHIEDCTRHILASYRPTVKHPTIRHQLCEMINRNISPDPTVIENVCSCNVIQTFHGGRTQTVLSKTMVLKHPADDNRLLVCAGDETNNSVHIWDSGAVQLTQRLITAGITVDMCSFTINNTTYLATLTDKLCKIFKWT